MRAVALKISSILLMLFSSNLYAQERMIVQKNDSTETAFRIKEILKVYFAEATEEEPIPSDTIPSLPGDTIPSLPSDTIPFLPGDTIPSLPSDTVPSLPVDTIITPTGSFVKGNLASGEVLTLERNSVKNYKSLSFTARINGEEGFDTLMIGHGMISEQCYGGSYLEINRQTIVIHSFYAEEQAYTPIKHGLNIQGDIRILFRVFDIPTHNYLRIESGSQIYEKRNIKWEGCNGTIFAASQGSDLYNCNLSWSASGYRSPIWFFGDSYFTLDPARWTYHMLQDGYSDVLLNGFSGAHCYDGIRDVETALKHNKPQILVWMLGMNDPDSETDINPSWAESLNKLQSLSKTHDFMLVLCTIPSTQTGMDEETGTPIVRKMGYKNEVIRNSKLRYIDFSQAVGSDDDIGQWYEGTSDSSGMHPSNLGARLLYSQVLSDLPELMECLSVQYRTR